MARAAAALTWPLSNMAWALAAPPGADANKAVPAATRFKGKAVADTPYDHLMVQLATLPKLAYACAAYYYFSPLAGKAYPTAEPGGLAAFASLGLNEATARLVAPIVLRDLAVLWVAAGLWDYIVYFSPLAARFAPNKLNPEPTPWKNRLHDMFWSHVSTLVSSAFEVLVLSWWARGVYAPGAAPGDAWWTHAATLAWLATMPYWRLMHFYCVHRFMHPWRTTSVPDVGKVMYKFVHSLHHKSKNPVAWSGISMHPVESSMYYHAMLLPVFFGAHPLVMLYTKLDLTMAALIGHDGVGFPGGASQPHWLHHHKFECNYGENYAPMDWIFGSEWRSGGLRGRPGRPPGAPRSARGPPNLPPDPRLTHAPARLPRRVARAAFAEDEDDFEKKFGADKVGKKA